MKKFLIILTIILLISCLTITIIYAAYKPDKVVLMYHSIQETPLNDYEDLFVRPEDFETQLKVINESGVTAGFLNEFDDHKLFITFDDGYADNYDIVFPLIKKYDTKITIFLITALIGENGYLNEGQIKEMANSGLVSFQSHTHNHSDLLSLDVNSVRDEILTSKSVIETITGQKVYALSYPFGKFNNDIAKLVSEHYSYAVNTKGPNLFASNEKMQIPRIGVSRDYETAKLISLLK